MAISLLPKVMYHKEAEPDSGPVWALVLVHRYGDHTMYFSGLLRGFKRGGAFGSPRPVLGSS